MTTEFTNENLVDIVKLAEARIPTDAFIKAMVPQVDPMTDIGSACAVAEKAKAILRERQEAEAKKAKETKETEKA